MKSEPKRVLREFEREQREIAIDRFQEACGAVTILPPFTPVDVSDLGYEWRNNLEAMFHKAEIRVLRDDGDSCVDPPDDAPLVRPPARSPAVPLGPRVGPGDSVTSASRDTWFIWRE